MARFLLFLTIVIGLGAAYLGYQASEQAKVLQDEKRSAIEDRDKTKVELKKKDTELTETKKTLEETEAAKKTAESERDAAKTAADMAKADLVKAETSAKDAESKLATIQAEFDKLKTEIGEVKPAELAAKIKELGETKTRLETELTESKLAMEAANKRAEETEAQFAAKDLQIKAYKDNYVRNGLAGKVVAYNPGWNFVVLNLGDKSGLKSGVQMVVTRAGAMIGKVKVTTVEPTQAIADVLPGTIPRGESVQPGDTVIYQGDR